MTSADLQGPSWLSWRASLAVFALVSLAACGDAGALTAPRGQDTWPAPKTQSRRRLADAQFVLLKADDLYCCPLDPGWRRFVDLVRTRNIRAGLGIIGNSLERVDAGYVSFLRSVAADARFEIWNHGYDHVCQPDSGYWEFRNSGLDHQVAHLRRSQDLVRQRIGYTMTTFGAPCNAIDADTRRAIDEDPDIRAWLYGDRRAGKAVVLRTGDAEYPTHHPMADSLITRYDPTKRYLALQLHPGGWTDAEFAEFERILDFLAAQGVQYVTPSELGTVILPGR